jgi:hypothetical protein
MDMNVTEPCCRATRAQSLSGDLHPIQGVMIVDLDDIRSSKQIDDRRIYASGRRAPCR